MQVLITAGGMRQPVDDVRSLVNSSRGALGLAIAEALLAQQRHPVERLWYLHGPDCCLPDDPRVRAIAVADPLALDTAMREVLTAHEIAYVVHSMAVADYLPAGAFTAQEIRDGMFDERTPTKISSDHEELFIRLRRAPKVIDLVKEVSPRTFLVGFKLLSQASDAELSAAAFSLLRRSRANLVLANDLAQIRSGAPHRGLLVYPEQHTDIIEGGKAAIAARLVETMLRRGDTRYGRSVQTTASVADDTRTALPTLRAAAAELGVGDLPEVDGGTYGNMSVRVVSDDTAGAGGAGEPGFVITGRGVDKRGLSAERLALVVDRELAEPSAYREVRYAGPVKPSIDSAIHGTLYAHTGVDAMLHIHDPGVYEGVALTENNYACGTERERDSIIAVVPAGAEEFVCGFHKHGLLFGGGTLDRCVALLAATRARMHLLPAAALDTPATRLLISEWERHWRDVSSADCDGTATGPLLDRRHWRWVMDAADPDACAAGTAVRGRPVGLVSYLPAYENGTWSGDFFIYLSEHHARTRGLGVRVLALVEEMARRDGCARLRLWTKPDCRVTDYYEQKLGFAPPRAAAEGMLVMERALTPVP